MSEATASRAREPEAVPLRKPGADKEPRSAWGEEAVPLRVVAERVEADEWEERLAVVTGRRRARRR
jgi:hypothetical protein